ncbi:hypothetical protein ABID25_006655 [Mesorhizobium abyssinicae]
MVLVNDSLPPGHAPVSSLCGETVRDFPCLSLGVHSTTVERRLSSSGTARRLFSGDNNSDVRRWVAPLPDRRTPARKCIRCRIVFGVYGRSRFAADADLCNCRETSLGRRSVRTHCSGIVCPVVRTIVVSAERICGQGKSGHSSHPRLRATPHA